MKHILVIGRALPSPETGMIGLFEYAQATAIAARGLQVTYLAIDTRSVKTVRRVGLGKYKHTAESIPSFEWAAPLKGLPVSIVQYIRTKVFVKLLRKIEDDFGPVDVVYAHFPAMTLTASFIDCLSTRGTPLVIMEHWTKVLNKTMSRSHLKTLQRAAESATAIGAVSEDLKDAMITLIPFLDRRRIRVIPNFVPQSTGHSPTTITQALHGRDANYQFVAIGRLVDTKRLDLLLTAFSKVVRKARATLVIAGDGQNRENLEMLAQAEGIQDSVRFLGWQDPQQIQQILLDSDCYVSASPLETFGVPTVEAWMSGTPSIGAANNPLRHYFNHDNGILFDTDNVDSLAQAMDRVIKDRERYKRDYISKYAEAHFSERAVIAQILEHLGC